MPVLHRMHCLHKRFFAPSPHEIEAKKSPAIVKNLQAIFWQTPSKYRGPHINDMRRKQPRSDDTKKIHGSGKFAKGDPKAGSKIRSKTRALITGLLYALTKALTHDLPAASLGMRDLARTKQIRLSRDKLESENFHTMHRN